MSDGRDRQDQEEHEFHAGLHPHVPEMHHDLRGEQGHSSTSHLLLLLLLLKSRNKFAMNIHESCKDCLCNTIINDMTFCNCVLNRLFLSFNAFLHLNEILNNY